MATLSIATTAMSVMETNSSAEREADNANNAAAADYAALEEQARQTDDVYKAEAAKSQLEALRLNASVRVAQGESGLSGKTSLREQAALRLKAATELSTLETNRTNDAVQAAGAVGKVSITNKGRIGDANAKRVGAAAAGLQIVGSGLEGGYKGYQVGQATTGGRKPGPRKPSEPEWMKTYGND